MYREIFAWPRVTGRNECGFKIISSLRPLTRMSSENDKRRHFFNHGENTRRKKGGTI